MNRILILIPYFGELPVYFKLFIKSISYNKDIDFLLISDALPTEVSQTNFIFKQIELNDLVKLIGTNLNYYPNSFHPYKLCDYKPTYGLLFADEIKSYDYWGYCDIDLIFGNISKFLERIQYNEYDIVTFRPEWLSGSFAIFKNKKMINELFLKNENVKEILESSRYLGFDECGGQLFHQLLGKNFEVYKNFPQHESISHIISRNPWIKLWNKEKIIKESLADDEILRFNHGTITSLKDGTEYLHYHYITEKKQKGLLKFPDWATIPNEFYISKSGFWKKDVPIVKILDVTRKKVKKYNTRKRINDLSKKIAKYILRRS